MHLYFDDLYFDLSMFLMLSTCQIKKFLSKIFSKLLHAETNLCGGDSSMIGLYGSYFCFHHYNIQ